MQNIVRMVVFVSLLAGCQAIEEQMAERQKALSDRNIVAGYSAAVATLGTEREDFLKAVQRTNSGKSADQVVSIIQEHTLVALGRYSDALSNINPSHQSLGEIHQVICKAVDGLRQSYQRFVDGLSPENYIERRKLLESEYAKFYQQQSAYRTQLAAYLEGQGLELRRVKEPLTTN